MSLNKSQFEALVYQVIKKIKSVEGAESYILDTPGRFDFSPNTHLHYQITDKHYIDLNKLSDDGAMIPSNDYHTFIDQLLVDTQELIKAVRLQRQPFLEYMEKIEKL